MSNFARLRKSKYNSVPEIVPAVVGNAGFAVDAAADLTDSEDFAVVVAVAVAVEVAAVAGSTDAAETAAVENVAAEFAVDLTETEAAAVVAVALDAQRIGSEKPRQASV